MRVNQINTRNYYIVNAKKDLSEYNWNDLSLTDDCPIILNADLFQDFIPRLQTLKADQYLIITDTIVDELYANKLFKQFKEKGISTQKFIIPQGEIHKTFSTLNVLATKILDHGISKNTVLILLGGGVLGNLAGLLAALLMRGIRFVHVPTTVMSQLDSTTGGKQAVNTTHGKNLLGTYYEPEFIFIDTNLIKTLPKRQYNSGIAEAIKHGLCQSKELLLAVERNEYQTTVEQTINCKIKLIQSDPKELHEGLALVYGHTLGHAIEIVSNHKYTHGEAISIGMVAAAKISFKLGFCDQKLVTKHIDVLSKQELPVKLDQNIDIEKIIDNLIYDKKQRDKVVKFVLLENISVIKKINGMYSHDVPVNIIKEVLSELHV